MTHQFNVFHEKTNDLRPICRMYECLAVAVTRVKVRVGQGDQVQGVVWAVGSDGTGSLEVAGVWLAAASGKPDIEVVIRGLQLAGLERARFVIARAEDGTDPDGFVGALGALPLPSLAGAISMAALGACPKHRRHLVDMSQLLWRTGDVGAFEAQLVELSTDAHAITLVPDLSRVAEAIAAFASALDSSLRERQRVLNADLRMQELAEALERRVRRHGSVGSQSEATEFVMRTLDRQVALRSSTRSQVHSYRRGLKSAPLLGSVRGTTLARV